jgi:DNA-binding CsgD family transcriptional regulator/cell division protein FtsB
MYNSWIRGLVEYKKKTFNKSIVSFEKAIRIAKEYNMCGILVEMYPEVAKSYNAIGDFKTEAYLLKRTQSISDSLETERNRTLDLVINPEKEKKESLFSKNNIFIGLAFILTLILLTFLIHRYNKREKLILKAEHESEETVENEKLNVEELEAEELDIEKLNYIMELAKTNNVFYFKFLELFPTFSQTLLKISSGLSSSDLEYCALIRLNFDSKQIAVYKKVTVGSVDSKKHRIRKKFNISSNENMHIWLINIQKK